MLDDENYVGGITHSSNDNPTTKSGESWKKSTKSIAAEVADMLAASSSSQYIMTSVLSTFAAEEAKTAQLAKSSSAPEQVVSQEVVYQKTQPSMMQNQILNSQGQYLSLANAPPLQYMNVSSGIVTSYGGYATFPPPLPPGPPPHVPPPLYTMSPLVPPQTHSSLQINQQQQQQQSSQFNQFLPAPPLPPGPSFRPVAPPNQASGMVYYAAAPPHPLQ